MNTNTFEIYYSACRYYDSIILEKESIVDHKDYLYIRCPVWNHLFDRIFVLKSPVDFEIELDSDNVLKYKIENDDAKTINFFDKQYERNTFQNELITVYIPDLSYSNPIIQFSLFDLSIWTPEELNYIWMEFGDHPMTSYKNNFIAMSGWFNLANHPRSTSLGIKFVDKTKPVIVKKGDPLYRIRFYSEDLNDLPVLIKKNILEFPDEKMSEKVAMIRKNPEFLKSLLFEKNAGETT